MRSVLRRCVVFLLCLWFPLQGVAGVVMPFCAAGGHGESPHLQAGGHPPAAGEHEHCPGTADDAPPAQTAGGDLACDQCSICHLACASVLPAQAMALAAPDAPVIAGLSQQHLPSHFPDSPFRPPRALAA